MKPAINVLLASAVLAAAPPAAAHHPMGGATPVGVTEGLLSGLAHPLLGFEHALLLVALALATLREPRAVQAAALYVVACALGAALAAWRGVLPGTELAVAATLVGAGAALLLKDRIGWAGLAAAVAVAGAVHGHALGEAIVSADRTAAVSYLVGLTVVQLLVVAAIGRAAARFGAVARDVAVRATALACMTGAAMTWSLG